MPTLCSIVIEQQDDHTAAQESSPTKPHLFATDLSA
jgi:hypothetical protein